MPFPGRSRQRPASVVRQRLVTTHHDRLFRYVFSDPEQAAGEIQVLLPEEVSRLVDWRTLRPLSGTFVDEVLDERRSDILFRVDLGGREALLYLLLEHQSTSDSLMPFRLLRYMVRIWDGYLAENPTAKTLPMVVHHSEDGWRAPTEFASGRARARTCFRSCDGLRSWSGRWRARPAG